MLITNNITYNDQDSLLMPNNQSAIEKENEETWADFQQSMSQLTSSEATSPPLNMEKQNTNEIPNKIEDQNVM